MWYNKWFGTYYYDLLYAHRDDTEAHLFINNLVLLLKPAANARILDLGCGKGRHALYLHQLGYAVTGVDLSADNIAYCKQFETDNLEFHIHDMRRYFRINNFDCVFNLFTSFGYFEKLHHNFLAAQSAAANLKPGGFLVLDYFNAHFVENNLQHDTIVCKEEVVFRISKKIEDNFVVKTINVEDKNVTDTFYERVELLYPHHFEELLQKVNLTIVHIFGSYELATFDKSTSPRFIIIAQKN